MLHKYRQGSDIGGKSIKIYVRNSNRRSDFYYCGTFLLPVKMINFL